MNGDIKTYYIPLFFFSWLKTQAVASSGVTVSQRPSQATMQKSSVPFICTVVTSGSEQTYGL